MKISIYLNFIKSEQVNVFVEKVKNCRQLYVEPLMKMDIFLCNVCIQKVSKDTKVDENQAIKVFVDIHNKDRILILNFLLAVF